MEEEQKKPKITFCRDLNKITFLNQEAFDLMELALENPAVLDEATFELDSDFHDFFKEATNEKASVDNVRKYLKNELIKCEETYKYLKEKNETVAINLLNGDGNYQILDSAKLGKKADVEKILDPEAGHAFLDSLYRAGKEKGL